MNYVEQVPTQLKPLPALCSKQKPCPTANIFTNCLRFFTHQPELIAQGGGWITLLAEAYLAHRVVEELYDRANLHGYFPAITQATVQANIIVHGVLGRCLPINWIWRCFMRRKAYIL